ncbi:unnamed protein product [Ostreobium quekettii]|uniref:Peroxiredoxin-like 2A n=1 Tax=Ostreobium quekettii TaxID=121088 RepID=A0A8S1ISW8_9CHLO|nr:unnamed protein product [Ostreobium quekettii]|eukprot:evm.model.scf_728EXC.6 EVM.evm.TU.scf_728EXC.6   scf_728EXC:38029-39223(+)
MAPLPSIETLSAVKLKTGDSDKGSFPAGKLWEEGPALVVVLRRPGCVACRGQALEIMDLKARLDELGVKAVVLVHEWIQREVDGFKPKFWPGELYFDHQKGFYKALGGGTVRRKTILDLLNPFSRAWKNVRKAQARVGSDHNLNGDGCTMGGLFVVAKGKAGVQYMFVEETFGDHAPADAILKAAEEAASKS